MSLLDLPLNQSEFREVRSILEDMSDERLQRVISRGEPVIPSDLLGPPFNLRAKEVSRLAAEILRQRAEQRARERERRRQRQREQEQQQSDDGLPVNPLAVVVIIVVLIFGAADRSEPKIEDDDEEEEEK